MSNDNVDNSSNAKKRKSRFSDDDTILPSTSLQSSATTTTTTTTTTNMTSTTSNAAVISVPDIAAMEAKLAQQIASISSLLSTVAKPLHPPSSSMPTGATATATAGGGKKAVQHTLRLNAEGKEIDVEGNVVQHDLAAIKTIAANVTSENLQKRMKIENPYLAHTKHTVTDSTPDDFVAAPVVNSRANRIKKGLKFVEPGKFISEAEELQAIEAKKSALGISSGRRHLSKFSAATATNGDKQADNTIVADSIDAGVVVSSSSISDDIPDFPDDGFTAAIEWWDEAYLPKDVREKINKKGVFVAAKPSTHTAAVNDATAGGVGVISFDMLSITNVKTYKYIQHPACIKPLGGEKAPMPLPTFLTRKEKKRMRKQRREEKEREKRDMQMMGLLPAAEPKFKLSNFMKILGDQAMLDPSKIEMKVMEQIKGRQLAHEARNNAAKLTPEAKRFKKLKKYQEDTTKQVHVSLYSVKDFSSNYHQSIVDKCTKKMCLSGMAILCQEAKIPTLIIVEGGPKGTKSFNGQMVRRMKWNISSNNGDDGGSDDGGSDDDGDDDDDDNGAVDMKVSSLPSLLSNNECKLLWNGTVPKRMFTAFRFQDCKTQASMRKMLEVKNVPHYFDILLNSIRMSNDT